MKIENLEEANRIKKLIDGLQSTHNDIQRAIKENHEPQFGTFVFINAKTPCLSIEQEYLNWRKMLEEAETSVHSQIVNLKVKFENLD